MSFCIPPSNKQFQSPQYSLWSKSCIISHVRNMGETQESLIRKLELYFNKAWITTLISKMHLENGRVLKDQLIWRSKEMVSKCFRLDWCLHSLKIVLSLRRYITIVQKPYRLETPSSEQQKVSLKEALFLTWYTSS